MIWDKQIFLFREHDEEEKAVVIIDEIEEEKWIDQLIDFGSYNISNSLQVNQVCLGFSSHLGM